MKHLLAGIIASLPLLLPVHAAAQPASRAPKTSWKAPRTPEGTPDLQGLWTNNVATPLERPRDLAGKTF